MFSKEQAGQITKVAAIAVAGLVVAIGILFQAARDNSKFKNAKANAEAVKILSSKAVVSTVVYGQVTGINGKVLSLNYNGEDVNIAVKQDAVVYALNQTGTGSSQQAAKFEDIKQGYNVSINLKILSDGQLEGQTVFILPAPTETK